VDLNADHLAACIVDAHGNPVAAPVTVAISLTGPASQRDGRLRAAISEIIRLAREHGCAGIAIENLGFADARATGRETMGRGKRGKKFRHSVAGIPTAQFRERIRGMAWHQGLVVVAVDPAYTSRWGGQHWQAPLQQQAKTIITRHHGAAVAIGRRALGYGIRRRPGVTARDRRIATRRAAGQAVSRPGGMRDRTPSRTSGTAGDGRKDLRSRGDQRVLLPAPEDRSRGAGLSPASADPASTGHLS
jgi:IS605 OrfB family transposase